MLCTPANSGIPGDDVLLPESFEHYNNIINGSTLIIHDYKRIANKYITSQLQLYS